MIEVYGVPNDHMKQQTRAVKNNGELFHYLEKNLPFLGKKFLEKKLCKKNLVRENVCYTSGFCGNLSEEIQFGTSDLNSWSIAILEYQKLSIGKRIEIFSQLGARVLTEERTTWLSNMKKTQLWDTRKKSRNSR